MIATKTIREISSRLQNDALPKYLSKRAFDVCGKKLGLLQKNTFVFGEMDEAAVFMDYCIYDYSEDGGNAVSRYIADYQLDPDSDEHLVLKAMSESFHTLLQVESVLPGVGVLANDLIGDKQFLLVDIGFSHAAVRGVVIATRILPFEEFAMTSGAALPVDEHTLLEISNSVLKQFAGEDGEHITVDMREKADFTAAIIRICLENNSSSQIEYRDVADAQVESSLRRGTRVGRNHPCPCGSGRKYKRCCGP